jgi:mRNA interferase HigB
MHVISRKALLEFAQQHPDSKTALDAWFRIFEANEFGSFDALRRIFPSVDKVGDLYVFNIGGNKYRLIAALHFNRQKVYVRQVLTHAEYDKGRWKE